jgi:glycosyltransferase involved in cell wall biosynthesis
MTDVVVVTPDVVGERMAGPGIRAYHLAAEIGRRFSTTLVASFLRFTPAGEPFEGIGTDSPAARDRIRRARVVIGQPTRLLLSLQKRSSARFCFDLFDPVVLELRELYGRRPAPRQFVHLHAEWWRLRRALRTGDGLLFATARQRDFYTGVYSADAAPPGGWLQRWIEVPFGCEIDETQPAEKPQGDIAWGGGLWPWLDSETAIDGVRRANAAGVRCRLRLPGAAHPNPAIDVGRAGIGRLAEESPDLVVVGQEWVPYRQRIAWLRTCKAAIMLHRATVEAEYSIRTRFFDALTAGLPVIATRGGLAADLVEREGLGVVVPPSDAEAVAAAIRRLFEDEAFYRQAVSNIMTVRTRFAWPRVALPLIERIGGWMGQE